MALDVVSGLVNRLCDLAVQKAFSLYDLPNNVDSLKRELQRISAFLKDADSRQKYDERVKNWVREIRQFAYDADNVIDTFVLNVERHRLNPKLLSRHSVAKKIEDLTARIGEIANSRTKYGVANIGESSSSVDHPRYEWRRSSPHLCDESVVGLTRETEEILEKVLDPRRRQRTVISIVGMGGIGKTTLAMKVFREVSLHRCSATSQAMRPKSFNNDPVVSEHFEICVWVSVNNDPDMDDLLVGMIRDVKLQSGVGCSDRRNVKTADLVKELFDSLTWKRYLVVVDDIWKKGIWNQMKKALPDNGIGSRMILTTRSIEIATHADSDSNPFTLQPLNDVESRKLFLQKAFQLSNSDDTWTPPADLEDLSWELSRKCGGLPLALVVLGGLLSGKPKEPFLWLDWVNSMSWESTDDGKQCLEILALSYNDLPYYMKSCFCYFGAFPEGSDIPASKLIELWTAEHLIVREEGKMIEETAYDYLEELIQRCLIQAIKRGSNEKVKRIRLHDLLRELSLSEAKECQFLLVKDCSSKFVPRVEQEVQEVHRLSLHDASQSSITLEAAAILRALLIFNNKGITVGATDRRSLFKPVKEQTWMQMAKSYIQPSNSPSVITYGSSSTLDFLRVLDLEGTHCLHSFPEEIKNMIHLRYLRLRDTNVNKLPAAIKTLQLQTLDIRGTEIRLLPDAIWSIKTLRHLYVDDIFCPTTKLEGLINIQTLHGVLIDGEFPLLRDLRKLAIKCYGMVVETFHPLRQSVHLASFEAHISIIPSDVFTTISTHRTLQKLKLKGRLSMKQLPNGGCLPPYLAKLSLDSLQLEEDPMPILEKLKCLRILKLWCNAYVGQEMNCSVGGFPRLHHLEFCFLSKLAVWGLGQGAMPGLTHLTLRSCSSLEMLPAGLRHVTTLQKLELLDMDQILHRVRRDEGEDWSKIQHVPSKIFRPPPT